MISPSWNGPRTHLFDAPVVTTDVANHSSVHCVGPTHVRHTDASGTVAPVGEILGKGRGNDTLSDC